MGSAADSQLNGLLKQQPQETVQRLFQLFNEVWLSFDPSASVPEVLGLAPIPELIDYSENFLNHISLDL